VVSPFQIDRLGTPVFVGRADAQKRPPWPYEGSVPLGQAQEHLLLSLNAQPPNAARRERFLVAIDGAKLNFTEKRLQFWYLWACR
jgi:hypothetical protein